MHEETNVVGVERVQKRNVERRCPICDRGHMCFSTAADLEPEILNVPNEIKVGSEVKLAYDTVGTWFREKITIFAGDTVVVKNIKTGNSGDLRAMVELEDGNACWVGVRQLTRS